MNILAVDEKPSWPLIFLIIVLFSGFIFCCNGIHGRYEDIKHQGNEEHNESRINSPVTIVYSVDNLYFIADKVHYAYVLATREDAVR